MKRSDQKQIFSDSHTYDKPEALKNISKKIQQRSRTKERKELLVLSFKTAFYTLVLACLIIFTIQVYFSL